MSWRESNLCKSPLASELKHQKLFKMATPPWKETYRKKCKERLVQSRHSLLQQIRMGESAPQLLASSVEQILTSEFTNLKTSQLNPPSEPLEESTDELLQMLETVRVELMLEEQQALDEWMKKDGWVEDGVDEWMVDSEAASQEFEDSQNFIVCPLCHKNSLTIASNAVQCECGLRIDTEQDALSLSMIQSTLIQSADQHSKHCTNPPSFNLFKQRTASNLLMSCKRCDFVYIII